MTLLSRTSRWACAAALPISLLFTASAQAKNTMDDLVCNADGGMQTYVRDMLTDLDEGSLSAEDRAVINNRTMQTSYIEDLVPLIMKMQRNAAKAAVDIADQDTTGMAYPIVRDERL